MTDLTHDSNPQPGRGGRQATLQGFPETRWSQMALAVNGGSIDSEKALAKLCESYWHPIYSFLRRRGHGPHDVEDLTQQFFVRLLGKEAFTTADRTKGRFCNYLLGALKHFPADEHRKSNAQKREGGAVVLSIDVHGSEVCYVEEPDSDLTPDQVYNRRWTASLLSHAFVSLRADFEDAGETGRFDRLKGFLSGEAMAGEYERSTAELNMTMKATKMAVYRLRQRYRQMVRVEVGETLTDRGEIDDELQQLFG